MITFDALPHSGQVLVPEWGVLMARGRDAKSFLHGQLTQDITHLAPGRSALAGYCSAKGRLMATFVVWVNTAGDVFMAGSAELLASVAKRLSMFVLRADCKLQVLEWPVQGCWRRTGLGDAVANDPWPATAWGVTFSDDASVMRVRLPDVAGVQRVLQTGPGDADLRPPSAPSADFFAQLWRTLEVASGVPRVVLATQDQFVPQMVNLELVGGVNFQKGCYPGQEVVARSQYRGTLKRRTFLFEVDAPAAPGDEVFSQDDPEQPAGMVVLAAPWPTADSAASARHLALVEVKWALLQGGSGSLHLHQAHGSPLKPRDLPYEVPHLE